MNFLHQHKRSFSCLAAMIVSFLAGLAQAQDGSATTESATEKQESASLIRATRTMRKLDKDDNGTFEKSENAAAWKRLQKLDTNHDQVLTISELRHERLATLQTKGERKLNIAYKQTPQGKQLLDLYYPAKANGELPPVVIYTHGGGWAAGSKQGAANGSFKAVFEQLLGHGVAVASVDYRLCRPDSGTTMRDCVVDCKDAVRYLAVNSHTLGLDASRFLVMGDSAGGQIAQMLMLSPLESLPGDEALIAADFRIVAGVSWYGPCDFENIDLFNYDDRPGFRDRFSGRILGQNFEPAKKFELYREMSPVQYLKPSSPPLLMIQGDKDTTIPVKHAHYMKKRAVEVGAPVEVMIIKNSGHNWRKVGADIEPTREDIEQKTVQFFVGHL